MSSTSRNKRFIIGSIIILIQIIIFREYLFPFRSDQIVIEGQSCTCPHAKVVKGETYLESITPDSLKKYNLIYSEVYFENTISTPSDLMGVSTYLIEGEVVGKKSIAAGDKYSYPLIRIKEFKELMLYNLFSWSLYGLMTLELIVFILLLKRKSSKFR